MVARAGVLLLHHGSPYLPAGALSAGGWLAYNPYLPVMALFGLPGALGLPGKTWPWLITETFLLLYATFRVTLAPAPASGNDGRRGGALGRAAPATPTTPAARRRTAHCPATPSWPPSSSASRAR